VALHSERVIALRRSEVRELERLAAHHPALEPITFALSSEREGRAAQRPESPKCAVGRARAG
jgi:hypothetical protein